MKLQKLALGITLLGLFSACSNDDNIVNEEIKNQGDSFLAVNIVAPHNATRAFEDGLEAESKVKDAIFFFFTETGASALPAQKPTLTFPDNDNVNKVSGAILVFNSNNNALMPHSMIAVLNPTANIAALTTPSLTNLKDWLTDSYLNNPTDANFIMSNSVYKGNNGEEMIATPIKAENIFKTSDAALAAPVKIYVERLAAKVMATYTASTTINSTEALVNGSSLALKPVLKGWQIITTNKNSKLIKKIDLSLPNTPFAWNDPNNFRSYWAVSYQPTHFDEGEFNTVSYDEATLASGAYTYCMENTIKIENSTDYNTKLIAVAEVQDPSGNPVELMKWAGMFYTKDKMKVQIANMMEYYTKNVVGSVTTYTRITPDAFDFNIEGADNSFSVKAILADTNIEYFTLAGDVATKVSAQDINTKLAALGNILYWNQGKSYFYIDIKHLNNQAALVRNHCYKLTINSVTGLGNPVPKSDEKIYIEPPFDEDSYIAAEIDILSWNILEQNVDLNN